MIGPETKPRYYVRACSFGQDDGDYVEARFIEEGAATEFYHHLASLRDCVELWKDGVFVQGRGWDASKYWPDWKAKPWTPEAAPTAAGPWVNEKERSPDEWLGPGFDTREFLVVDGFGIRTARRAGKNDAERPGWVVTQLGFVKRVACWAQIGTFEI